MKAWICKLIEEYETYFPEDILKKIGDQIEYDDERTDGIFYIAAYNYGRKRKNIKYTISYALYRIMETFQREKHPVSLRVKVKVFKDMITSIESNNKLNHNELAEILSILTEIQKDEIYILKYRQWESLPF